VIPFNSNKNDPCAYILTASSTAQKTVSFVADAAGTVYYEYIGESSYGAFTTIAKMESLLRPELKERLHMTTEVEV